MDVSVREFRLRLSEYVRRARQGESFTITNRGHPVATLSNGAGLQEEQTLTLREPHAAYAAGGRTHELVGVRSLKAALPHYLRLVSEGQPVMVTERNEPVAELRAVERVPIEEFRIPKSASSEDAARMRKALREEPPPSDLWPLLRKGGILYRGYFHPERIPPLTDDLPDDYDGPSLSEIVMAMRGE